MVIQRSASLNGESKKRAGAMNPALTLQTLILGHVGMRLVLPPSLESQVLTVVYFPAWVWHRALHEDRDRQLSLGFGWASLGLKGTSRAQGHRPQETHTTGHSFLQPLAKLSFCLSSEML